MFTGIRLIAFCFLSLAAATTTLAGGDYPTTAIVDYVYGCMKANGETRHVLQSCSCSLDVIASIVPYERYEAAETYRSLGLQTGERGVLFRQSAPAKSAVSELRRAQAEAEVRCF
jgi:poly-beta-hydroxyalkanoate depolymerase